MNFLMTQTSNQVCAVYLDVTENRMLTLTSEGYMLNAEQMKDLSVSEWLKKYIYPNIVYKDELDEFRGAFRRVELLRDFEGGIDHLEYHHCYRYHSSLRFYQVDVMMFKNQNIGHVEALATWKDVTRRYIDTEVRKILYQSDYEAVALIDTQKQTIYFRSCHFKRGGLRESREYSYEETIEKMTDLRIAEWDKNQFTRYTALNFLTETLRMTGQYSFQAYNVDNKVERYSYHWFDRRRGILLVVIEDMTEEMESDSVTGAWNRKGFFHRTEEILKKNPKEHFAILYFNIQRFKAINDLFGYEVGDGVLHQTVSRLKSSFLRPLVVGRIEADRFAALVNVNRLNLEKLPELMHRVYMRNNNKIDIYERCGIFYIPENCELSVSDMCDRAKLAKLYISNQYVQPYSVFNEDMKEDYEQRSMALIQLDDAIKNHEIKVYYHPIYDAWTNEIVFAEALARWESPQKGMILPGKFIPPLEESGYITKLDAFMHGNVQSFLERRKEEGKPTVGITVNLSRMDLMDEEIMTEIIQDVNNSELSRDKIYFEITESAYATITEEGIEFLSNLHKSGVSLLVDDFGSGVSSFSTIRDYDFDIIKLDMGFVSKLGANKKNNNILISLVELAHRLDMKVVAEGVETKEQEEFLRNYGCDYLQGFYFCKPMPEAQGEQLLDSKNTEK